MEARSRIPSATSRHGFHYGAFGEVIAQGGESTHRRQANGKEVDAASGLQYYGARYYDPLLLKWTSADPLYRFAPDFNPLEPQRANLYAFSNNNPVRYLDADGLDWMEKLCGIAVGALDGISGGLYSKHVLPRVTDQGDIEVVSASGDYESARAPAEFAVGSASIVVGGLGVIKGGATIGRALATGVGGQKLVAAGGVVVGGSKRRRSQPASRLQVPDLSVLPPAASRSRRVVVLLPLLHPSPQGGMGGSWGTRPSPSKVVAKLTLDER